jgi:DNA integrity scanning protein DisA with diadenylate cyclase activity
MLHRLAQLYETLGVRDLVQILILAVVLFGVLRFLSKTSGGASSLGRGLGLCIVGLFLLMQVIIAALDLTELSTVLDYLLTTTLLGMIIIFQPELRRGLMMRIEGKISARLIRNLFMPKSPLHDGAVILAQGRIVAAACQLPMRAWERASEGTAKIVMGMRHRAALCLSEETDAIVLVVSEETGRISLCHGGKLEPVAREQLARRLADLLTAPSPAPAQAKAA